MPRIINGALAALFLAFMAYAQVTQLFAVYGVNPNLVLTLIVVYSFFIRENSVLLLFALFGSLLLSWQPGVNPELLGFLVVLLAVIILQRSFRAQPYASCSLLIAGATFILTLIIRPSLFLAHPALLIAEAVYNVFLGDLFLGALMQFKK